MVRQPYTLQSVPPDISSTHLAPYTVITIVLTIFPVLYFMSPWLLYNYLFVFLNLFTFSPSPTTSLPSDNHTVITLYLWVCFYFVCLFTLALGWWESSKTRSWWWLTNSISLLVEVIQYMPFWDWLLSLSNIYLRFLGVFSWLDSSFLFRIK